MRHSYASSAGTVGVATLGDAATKLATLAQAFEPVPDVVGLTVGEACADESEDDRVMDRLVEVEIDREEEVEEEAEKEWLS